MSATRDAWLLHVLEAVPVAMIAFDSSGRVLGVNTAGEALFAAVEHDSTGKDTSRLGSLLPVEVREATQKLLSGESDGERGEVYIGEKRVGYTAAWARRHDEEPVLLLSAQALPSEIDTTTDFLSLASHELKTPLTAIKGGTQLLQRRLARAESAFAERDTRLLEMVSGQVDKLTGMVESLLEASRLSSGRVQLFTASHPVEEVLAEAVARFEQGGRPNPVHLETPPNPTRAVFDRRRLLQVMDALLDNAARYSPPDEPVTIRLLTGNGEVRVAVVDRGGGIPPQEQTRVFERFYRGSDMEGGLGLGLYIASELVLLHGGRMWLESEPGKGSTFLFSLPHE